MIFPRLDFEVDLSRELTKIGATKAESQTYVEGLPRGGSLVFATWAAERVETAAEIMNRHGADRHRGEQWFGTPVTRCGAPEHAPDTAQSGHGWPGSAGRAREPPFFPW
jgi:hypothetical protein